MEEPFKLATTTLKKIGGSLCSKTRTCGCASVLTLVNNPLELLREIANQINQKEKCTPDTFTKLKPLTGIASKTSEQSSSTINFKLI